MDYHTILLVVFFTFLCRLLSSNSIFRKPSSRLPPGPFPLPILGNFFHLGKKPHQSLANLSKKYGPLMSLKLGSVTAIVVSSPGLAKQLLQNHNQVVSSRLIQDVARALDHDKFSIVWLPAEAKWRSLRKICKEQLFSLHLLDQSQFLRREKVQELLGYVKECCRNGEAVNISEAAFTTTLNLLSNTCFSMDLAQYYSNSSQQLKEIVWALMELVGKPNVADYFPILRLVDPQGLRWKSKHCTQKLFDIFEDIIDNRLQSRTKSAATSSLKSDVLDALLDLNQENDTALSCCQIKHLILDLFIAGTETTSITVEWAMTELLCNPEKMIKARSELEQVLGKDVLVQETDISRLPYLQAIVKETFRLHPPAPLLIPHKAEAGIDIQGFRVPENAQIIVNIWAIGREKNIWQNPDSFLPERFLESKLDFKGQDFELIPFGAGRRICPGLQLGHRMVHLMLASLLHSFNWKFEEQRPEQMEKSEKFGLTLQKAIPLKATPIQV